VEAGETYYYVATAVASGAQSAYSNQAEATMPKDTTSTALTSSVNPSIYDQSVTFTATVTPSGGTPTGTVTFKDGSTRLGTGTLGSGKATFNTKTLSVASHSITGVYGGSTDFSGSTSPPRR
jgi:Bacterial Ig-like domain (group 3)